MLAEATMFGAGSAGIVAERRRRGDVLGVEES
jgi:hypothetical protein